MDEMIAQFVDKDFVTMQTFEKYSAQIKADDGSVKISRYISNETAKKLIDLILHSTEFDMWALAMTRDEIATESGTDAQRQQAE